MFFFRQMKNHPEDFSQDDYSKRFFGFGLLPAYWL